LLTFVFALFPAKATLEDNIAMMVGMSRFLAGVSPFVPELPEVKK